MSDFSDKEDRILIQLTHRHDVAKGKKIPWREIAMKMKTKKTPEQLRLRVVCLKKRFGNILANFPRWYFLKPAKRKSQIPSEVNVRSIANERGSDSMAVYQRTIDRESHRNGSILQTLDDDNDAYRSLLLLTNDSENSYRTAPTQKKLRTCAKNLHQTLRNIEPEKLQVLSSGRADIGKIGDSMAKPALSTVLNGFNKHLDCDEKDSYSIESHLTIEAQSVKRGAVVRQLVKKVQCLKFEKVTCIDLSESSSSCCFGSAKQYESVKSTAMQRQPVRSVKYGGGARWKRIRR
jgi:hypothetical protein